MRIEKVGDNPPDPPKVERGFAPVLNDRIQKVADPSLRAELGSLISEIDQKSKKLLSVRGRKEFEEYKGSVKKFMSRVLSGSFRLEESHGQRKDGKFVVYLVMKKVDEALDSLGQLMVMGQQDSMRIVALMDEIRGLLFDMTL